MTVRVPLRVTPSGAQIQAVASPEGEVGIPLLGVIGGQGEVYPLSIVEYDRAVYGEEAGAEGIAAVDIHATELRVVPPL